jgi:hypothetical protein
MNINFSTKYFHLIIAALLFAWPSLTVRSQTPPALPGARSLERLASGNVEVVAPVGQQTVLELTNPPTAVLTVDQGTFRGTVLLNKELNKWVVTITPEVGADTADVFILQGGSRIKTLRIISIAVAQETTAVESQAEIPDPESRDYTVYSENKGPGRDFYNGASRQNLRTIKISGRRLNIRPHGPQGILERLMPGGAVAADIGTVELYAKEVIIGAPLRIPGADVKIYADILRFEDHDNVASSLETTPLPPDPETRPGVSGKNGQKGGDVYLQVSQLQPADVAVRIKANGGVGQKGGPETPGAKGGDKGLLPHEPQIGGIVRSWDDLAPFRIVQGDAPLPGDWRVYATAKNVVWFKRDGNFEWGNGSWPGNGTQGQPGGQPGVGGSGGTVHATTTLPAPMLDLAGGSSGEKRPDAPSGEPGNPSLSIGIALERRSLGFISPTFYIFNVHRATKPPNVQSPAASQPQGVNGSAQADLRKGWLHPSAARALLTYGEDLYRMGFMAKAQEELQSLLQDIESPDVITEPAESYIAVKQRVNALQARISENRDYYGNPAGYVPALPLATAINLLQSEVSASGRILAISERVRMDAETGELNNERLTSVRDAAAREVVNLSDKLNGLAQGIPQLKVEAESVAQDEESLQLNCRQREEQLRHDADALANPEPSFLMKAVKTVGTLAKVCPVGQPILGAVGGAIDFATTLDQRTPWDSISQLPSLAKGFSQENVATSLQSYRQTVDNVRAMDPTHPRQFFTDLSSAANQMGKSLAEFKRMQDASRAPADKVDQIFQNLKGSDQPYRDLLNRASALTARKRLLGEKIDASIEEMGEVSSKISTLTNNVDDLNLQLTNGQNLIDHPAILATKDIGRQTRERLDFYHYILMKSFEYFTSLPYRGNRRASGTADSLAQLLTANNRDPQLAADAFTTVYTNEVRAAGRQIVNMLNAQGQRSQKSINITLNPNELATLNASLRGNVDGGDLFINLEDRSLIPVTDLEARLINIELVECDCDITGGEAANATLHVDFSVPPTGFIQTQAARLAFRRSNESPLWGATVDLTTQPTSPKLNQNAEDVGQVLESFINPGGNGHVSYIAPPPAYPGFKIRTRLESDAAQPLTPRIKKLKLKLTYSSITSNVVRAVRVTSSSPNGILPYIFVSWPDASGRRSGQANFTRVYDTDAQIELVAPTNLGNSRFVGWYRDQTRITTRNHLNVPERAASYRFEARYQ